MVDWKTCIRSNMILLYENLDTNNGLEGSMRQHNVIQYPIIRRIWSMKDEVTRIRELLEQILRGDEDRFNGFCEALNSSGQEHIVKNYLKTPNARNDVTDAMPAVDYDLEIPLSRDIKTILAKNWNEVIDVLNSDGVFLDTLGKESVFTLIQLRRLKSIDIEADRNSMILCNLEKTSLGKYKKFGTALVKTNQEHIWNILKPPELQGTSTNIPVIETGYNQALAQVEQVLDRTIIHQCTEDVVECDKPEACTEELNSERVPIGRHQDSNVDSLPDDKITFRGDCSIDFIRRTPTPEKLRDVASLIQMKLAYPCHWDGKRQGRRALVIANEFFDAGSLMNRLGTKVDVFNLENLLKYLNFDFSVYRNLTAEEIIQACRTERNKLESAHTIFVCFILSHGENGIVHGKDGKHVKLEELTAIFDGINCPGFRDKPKIFMIQACQGGAKTEGVRSSGFDESDSDVGDPNRPEFEQQIESFMEFENQVMNKHEKADMAIILATYPGYLAWRNEVHGSYFVQCVSDVFFKYSHEMHFGDMITLVTRRMNQCVMQDKFKQTVLYKTTLEKMIYLLPCE